jgi:hypothetical protein
MYENINFRYFMRNVNELYLILSYNIYTCARLESIGKLAMGHFSTTPTPFSYHVRNFQTIASDG